MRCGGIFDLPAKVAQLAALEARRSDPAFWDDHAAAAGVNQQISVLEGIAQTFAQAEQALADLAGLWELLAAESLGEDSLEYADFVKELKGTAKLFEQLEIES